MQSTTFNLAARRAGKKPAKNPMTLKIPIEIMATGSDNTGCPTYSSMGSSEINFIRMNERIKPMMPLSREDRIIKKNSLVFTRLYKLTKVLSGEGKIIAELIIKDINFQIIIKDIIEINVNRTSLLVVEIFIRYFSSHIFRREFQ